ncbi:pyrroline-5-carboxylate reductase [Mailhella massiliensis]|uniref:Pyrroline-5-carboxylate reductase n=1 Tax=Mailhella massiliensis TaxID=1903261 RepID=A0A921AY11_9BACT|nr:pyrroline-5-carboxylate reductase [Mailhella massiliensis]HJD98400.1 pyrroline-5-carboxylate reductase [Mailhella massiliensis]
MKRIGCIGCGNMGAGVLKGLVAHEEFELFGHDHTRAKVEAIEAEGRRVAWAASPLELARLCDVVILAVKPYQMEAMLEEIRPALDPSKVVLSLAAAFSMEKLRKGVEGSCPVARCMPNLPVIVGKGVFALCLDDDALDEARREALLAMFRLMGRALPLAENMFPAFSALVGCGPAFQLLFMEGLLNAGITMGFKAPVARELIAAMVEGTACLALEGKESFSDLRVKVCSPSGTTIRGVNHLERCAVPGHAADAVLEALKRDLEMAAAK